METTIKKWAFPFSFLLLVTAWFLIDRLMSTDKQPAEPMQIRPIMPSLIYKDQGDIQPRREDFFSIVNLNRSDSTNLLKFIAINACQISDTIHLEKYHSYRMEFYEHSPYLNDSSYHSRDRPLFHTADELDSYVSWVIYNQGKLSQIQWYKTGKETSQYSIAITKEIKRLFEQCRKK